MSLDRRPDFRRPVVSLLGLPFDAIDMPGAVAAVRDAAFSGRRLLVSTPNLDFAVAALQDPAFRRSVLRSDLSLVDGMPLVWLSRLLGLPVRERVSGSDLFEALRRHPGPPVRVYFYGGPPGVAAEAARRVNAERGGLVCVGHDEAGHGDVASMSSAGTLAAINAARPHFVALSLGARKGQAWLEANAERLDAPVLCYIGATVNFIAGAVPRAPVWMRRAGLEWVWRVAHEPALWRRYGHDAATLLPLVFTRVLPDALASRRRPDGSGAWVRSETASALRVALTGDGRGVDPEPLTAALDAAWHDGRTLVVDLAAATAIDARLVGLLLLAEGRLEDRGGLVVSGASRPLRRMLERRFAAALGDFPERRSLQGAPR